MQLRAIIIDDDELGIESLRLLIDKFIPDINVVAETSHAVDAIQLIRNYSPEIVFLDINMPEMNGFELLEKLDSKKFNLVFTTAHSEYGLKALKMDAVDYLMKPVNYRELELLVNRIRTNMAKLEEKILESNRLLNRLEQPPKNRIAVITKSGIEAFDIQDIISLESQSNYTRIYLSTKTITTPRTLKEFENLLCNKNLNFMRVHNSFVVNLQKIIKYNKEEDSLLMFNEQKIPVAKSRKEEFFKWLNI